MTEVSICVCTYRRPALAETLASLDALILPEAIRVEIVVVDNDAVPSAQARVLDHAEQSPHPIRYVHAPHGNISIARNAALDAAAHQLVAFIDDDEVAEPGWLAALLDQRDASGANIILGPVSAQYGVDAPAWMQSARLHDTAPVWTSGQITTGYSGNVLIDTGAPALRGLRFDLELGVSGGEDTLFFSTAHQQGARIGYAEEARVNESVPPSRVRLSWLFKRWYRMGTTHARILYHIENKPLWQAIPLACAKAGYLSMTAIGALPFARTRTQSGLRAAFHTGVVFGLISRSTARYRHRIG